MWTKDKPTKEGWYFWKKRKDTTDELKMFAYYIADVGGELSCWAEGTNVYWPKGGLWLKNCTYLGL